MLLVLNSIMQRDRYKLVLTKAISVIVLVSLSILRLSSSQIEGFLNIALSISYVYTSNMVAVSDWQSTGIDQLPNSFTLSAILYTSCYPSTFFE